MCEHAACSAYYDEEQIHVQKKILFVEYTCLFEEVGGSTAMAADYSRDALESLGKVVNRAGKILLGLLGLMGSSILIDKGLSPETIKIPFIEFSVSSRIALVLFVLGIGVGGWVLWFTLRHALHLLRHLEFELKVHPSRIRSTLSSSSFLTTSTLFLKIPLGFLGLFWLLASWDILVATFMIFGGIADKDQALAMAFWPRLILFAPFFMIVFGFKYAFLVPRSWVAGATFLKKFNIVFNDNVGSLRFESYDDEVDFFSSFVYWSVRRYGWMVTCFRMYFSDDGVDKLFKQYVVERMEVQILDQNNGKMLEQDFEEFNKFSREVKKMYFG